MFSGVLLKDLFKWGGGGVGGEVLRNVFLKKLRSRLSLKVCRLLSSPVA